MTRLCACGCRTPLDRESREAAGLLPFRADAKWAGQDCAERWKRANPGRSRRDARAVVVGRTQPERRRRSGVSIRVAARGARDVIAAELRARGYDAGKAHARATELVLPLVAAQHRSLIDA